MRFFWNLHVFPAALLLLAAPLRAQTAPQAPPTLMILDRILGENERYGTHFSVSQN